MIRQARHDDLPGIAEWTQDTFPWGDYISDMLPGWVDDPTSALLVFTDEHDRAIALARGLMLSDTEAWFGSLRVHPDHRGKRIAGEMAAALREWARDRGARVARLLIEEWNEPSIRHVRRIGMRHAATVGWCSRSIGDASPAPGGNGGRRVPAALRARPARAAEAEPALASWSVGEVGRAMRGLFASGWTLRRIVVDDLADAARNDGLWEVGAGWAMAVRRDDLLEVGWLEVREENAHQMTRAIVDLAVSQRVEQLTLWVPDLPWLERAARKAGCECNPMGVWEQAL